MGNPGAGGKPPEPWGPLDEQEEWKTEVEDQLRETRRKLEFQASYYQERQEAEHKQARTAWERLQLQVGNASMESVNINNPRQEKGLPQAQDGRDFRRPPYYRTGNKVQGLEAQGVDYGQPPGGQSSGQILGRPVPGPIAHGQ